MVFFRHLIGSAIFAFLFLAALPQAHAVHSFSSTTVGNIVNADDIGESIVIDEAGIVYVVGTVRAVPTGFTNSWVGKYNAALVLQASTTFPGSGVASLGRHISTGTCGNIYVTGSVEDVPGDEDILIVKYDSNLVFQASATFAGGVGGDDRGEGIITDAACNVYVTGKLFDDFVDFVNIWVAKYDANLVFLASATLNSGSADEGRAITLDSAGDILVTGVVNPTDSGDIWIGKFDSNLVLLSSTTQDGVNNGADIGRGITTVGTDVFVTGRIVGATNNVDTWVGKYDSSLVLQSSANINGLADSSDGAYGIVVDAGGNPFVAGRLGGGVSASGDDLAILTLDSNLVVQSSITLDGGEGSLEIAKGIALDAAGEVFIVGSLGTVSQQLDILIVHYTPALAFQGSAAVNSLRPGQFERGQAVSVDGSDIYVTGYVEEIVGDRNIWVAKYDTSLTLQSSTTFTGPAATDGYDEGHAIVTDGAGNIYVAGFIGKTLGFGFGDNDIWLGHYDSSLVLLASATFDGGATTADDRGFGIALGSGGEIYVTGQVEDSVIDKNIWVGHYDSSLVLQSSFSFTIGFDDRADGIAVDGSGNIFVVGSGGTDSSSDFWAGKLDSNLVLLASTTLNDAGNAEEKGRGVVVDGTDVFVTGMMETVVLDENIWVAKYDSSLVLLSSITIDSPGTADDKGWAIAASGTGEIYVAGSLFATGQRGNLWVSEYDLNLNLLSNLTFNGSSSNDEEALGIAVDAGGVVYAAGYIETSTLNEEAWVSRHTPHGSLPAVILSTASVGITSITWSWTNIAGETGFRVLDPSDVNLSGDLGADVLTWDEFNITTNTAFTRRVVAFDADSVSTSAAVTVFTLAAPPTAQAFVVVNESSVTVSWAANGNPGATMYRVELWEDGGSTITKTLTATTTTFLDLLADATHFFAVRAMNGDNILTSLDVVLSTITVGTIVRPGTATLSYTNIAPSSFTLQWTSGTEASGFSPSGTLYTAEVSTASDFSGTVLSSQVTSLSAGFVNLSTNSAYFGRVEAFNGISTTPFTGLGTDVTRAAPPIGSTLVIASTASLTVQWNVNGNPTGTVFEVDRSTDDVVFALTASPTVANFTDTNLDGQTTYYYRVRAVNSVSVATAYDITVSTFLIGAPLPLPPSGLGAESLASDRIFLNWTISPTTTVVRYNLYSDNASGIIDYAVLFASVASNTTSFLTPPLTSGLTYKFGLRAEDASGAEENNTSVVASAAALTILSGVRAFILSPPGGLKISGDRVSILAGINLGTEKQIKDIRFQYKASTASVWVDIPPATLDHPNPDAQPPFFLHWDVTSLTATNFDLRAVAEDLSSVADANPPATTVSVGPINVDLSEISIAGGKVQQDQKIFNSITNTIYSGDPMSEQITLVVIPPGAISDPEATLTMINNPINAPPPGDAHSVGIFSELTLSNGQTTLSGGNVAALSFTFQDNDGDGLVDGSNVRSDALEIQTFDAVSNTWGREFNSTSDLANRVLTGVTSHFSFFAALGPARSSLNQVRIFPNPYMPNSGRSDDGSPFASGDLNSGIIFDNLPPAVTIRIYTVSGQLVRELSMTNSTGRIQWDAAGAASGGYFAVFSSPGQITEIKKLGIVR